MTDRDAPLAAGPLPVFAEFEFADGRRVVASGRTEGEARKKLAALVKTELAARSCARPCRRVEP